MRYLLLVKPDKHRMWKLHMQSDTLGEIIEIQEAFKPGTNSYLVDTWRA